MLNYSIVTSKNNCSTSQNKACVQHNPALISATHLTTDLSVRNGHVIEYDLLTLSNVSALHSDLCNSSNSSKPPPKALVSACKASWDAEEGNCQKSTEREVSIRKQGNLSPVWRQTPSPWSRKSHSHHFLFRGLSSSAAFRRKM